MMNLTVELDRMRLRAFHGVMPQERVAGNIFEVTVSVTFTVNESALEADDIDSTVSYAVLADIVRREMSQPSRLLEHVALRIMRSVQAQFTERTASSGMVKITKLTPPMGVCVAGASASLAW